MMGGMRAAVLLLVLAFGSLQGISLTDCPCGSLCETKNACPDEKRHESADDCCSRTRAKDQQASENCFHLEPQTELDSGAAAVLDLPVICLGPVAILPISSDTPETAGQVFRTIGPSPPHGSRLLFLIHSTLLI
jgi:hypothetical protein